MARYGSTKDSRRNTPTTSLALALTVAMVVLATVVPLEATNANYRLCFTQVVGLPVLNPPQTDPCTNLSIVPLQAPHIDGCVKGDPGWTQAFRYVWGNGVDSNTNAPLPPNAAVQGIRDNTFLYLSVEVNNDTSLNANNLAVLTFSPTDGASPTDDRRIHIYPFKPNTTAGTPYTIEYWTNSSTWNNLGAMQSALPANTNIAIRSSGGGSNFSWIVEMEIPLAGFNIPATGRFGFYVNIMRVGTGGFASQYFWPSLTGNGVQITPEQHTPPTSNWGDATQDPALAATCKGVSLAWNDIVSNHPPDQIDATCVPGPPPNCNNSNAFTATLHNNSVDQNGNPITAPGILATFSIANFGLPSNWTPVPVGTPAGRAGPVDIPASLTASLSTSPAWNITDSSLIANYKANPDQCILVDLDSTAASCIGSPNNCVSLLNKSVKRNMWVLTASQVSKTAEISAKGYGAPPAGRTQHEFQLRVTSHREILKPDQLSISRQAIGAQAGGYTGGNKGRVVSRLVWAVNGCRFTGQYITIKGTTYELCDDVGAFGAVVEHFGATAVENWLTSLEGPGLTRDEEDKDSYRLRVPQDSVATVTVDFQPEEPGNNTPPSPGHFALFLDAGANKMLGTLGTGVNTGFSFNGGLEVIAAPRFSVEGIFGYHHFPGEVTSAIDLYQFSANAKTYLWNGPVRPFINGGPGGYRFSFGSASSTYFGGNVGGGVLFEINSRVGVQGSYNFHAVNTPREVTKFNTFQGGIRFVF